MDTISVGILHGGQQYPVDVYPARTAVPGHPDFFNAKQRTTIANATTDHRGSYAGLRSPLYRHCHRCVGSATPTGEVREGTGFIRDETARQRNSARLLRQGSVFGAVLFAGLCARDIAI